jgi:hypothetical protein
MNDLVFLGLAVFFFATCFLLIVVCEKLEAKPK